MKVYKALMLIILSVILSISCIAVSNGEFYFSDIDTTVKFEEDSFLTYEQQHKLARNIAYGENIQELQNPTADQTSIVCGILGHKIKSTLMYTVQHKDFKTEPRCLQKTYEVETCERCDYQNVKYVTQTHIFCCPND